MNKLRLLNFDDLFLLRLLLEGGSITSIASQLGLTQPAITQRVRKIERVFGAPLVQKVGRRVRLTVDGKAICNRADAALSLMGEVSREPASQVVSVGSRPEVGWSWLWPALATLRRKNPHLAYHCVLGSGEEILKGLGTGMLDAVLTSAPHTVRGYGAIEVAEETYVMVASPALARRVQKIEDLAEEILIEHDRSFPFHRYVDARSRARMKYRDVWFVGSSTLMREALVEGFGVGIAPEYLVRKPIQAGKLRQILQEVRIDSDRFRLIYRLDRNIEEPMKVLAGVMMKLGLR